jgi:hypothetical protein
MVAPVSVPVAAGGGEKEGFHGHHNKKMGAKLLLQTNAAAPHKSDLLLLRDDGMPCLGLVLVLAEANDYRQKQRQPLLSSLGTMHQSLLEGS